MSADTMLADVLERMFVAHELPRDGRNGSEARWYQDLWDDLAAAGLPWVSIPEEAGGSGGSIDDAFDMLRAVGASAAPVPLAETAVLAGWLLARAGLGLPEGPLTVVPDARGLTLTKTAGGWLLRGSARHVAFGQESECVVALCEATSGPHVVRIPTRTVKVQPGLGLNGEPRDALMFDDVRPDDQEVAPAPPDVTTDALRLRGAATRVVMMSAAIDQVESRTIRYAHDRHQFGKPIASFQAVQHRLVRIAEEALVARMAAALAVRSVGSGDPGLEVAAAKIVVGRAADEVAIHAHQAHGAIGMTREYLLHPYTRRLWTWRAEYGSAKDWSGALGRVAINDRDRLWPFVADGLRASAGAA
jgi:acyl-CoA dehydrogenase